MNNRSCVAALLVVLFTALPLQAGERPTPEALLKVAIRSPRIVYQGTMTVTYWNDNGALTEEVAVQFNPPNRYCWRFLLPDGRVDRMVVSDGRTERFRMIRQERIYSGEAAKATAKQLDPKSEWNLLLANYTLGLAGREPVAGRTCWVLALEPRTPGKPEQRLWIDPVTDVVLQVKRIRPNSRTAMVSRFVTFESWPGSSNPPPTVPRPAEVGPAEGHGFEPDFVSIDDLRKDGGFSLTLPPQVHDGFVFESADLMNLKGKPVHHIRYTDGLAVLSLFQTSRPARPSASAETGLLQTVSWRDGDHHYVLMGDVDSSILHHIAASLRRQP